MGENMIALLVLVVGICTVIAAGPVDRYSALNGHQIWRVNFDWSDEGGPGLLLSLLQEGKIDILGNDNRSSRFRVHPEDKEYVLKKLLGKNYKPIVEVEELATHLRDLEDTDLNEIELTRQGTTCTSTSCPLPLAAKYMTFDQIQWYINSIAKTYPSFVTAKSLGKTGQGRNVWMIKIASSSNATKSVWVEGGIHAREWISPAVTVQLVQNLINKQLSTGSLNGTDYYIVPVANPDGFVYTFTGNRLWRKNRAPTSNANCPGVDLNRNWDFQWGVGASTNPCSEVYRGPTPFSEAETKALSSQMKTIPNLKLMLAIHSYSQLLLYPWGYNSPQAAPDTPAMISLGKVFSDAAFSVNGVRYNVVNSAGGLYYASGATDDWAKGVLKTKYSYTLELRDTGTYGFLLPASQIEPSRKEIWTGFEAMVKVLD